MIPGMLASAVLLGLQPLSPGPEVYVPLAVLVVVYPTHQ